MFAPRRIVKESRRKSWSRKSSTLNKNYYITVAFWFMFHLQHKRETRKNQSLNDVTLLLLRTLKSLLPPDENVKHIRNWISPYNQEGCNLEPPSPSVINAHQSVSKSSRLCHKSHSSCQINYALQIICRSTRVMSLCQRHNETGSHLTTPFLYFQLRQSSVLCL